MIKLVIILMTAVSVVFLFAQSPHVFYQSDQWVIDPSPYGNFRYPDNKLVAHSELGSNEPLACYPLHSGSIRGVSDTIAISVYIENTDTIDFNIGSFSPEDWFMPVVYDVNLDPRVFSPLADTSTLSYSFEGWYKRLFVPVSKPTYIYKNRGAGGKPNYFLEYHVWGIPIGKTRLLMIETSDVPSGFTMLTNYLRPRVVKEPNSLGDTLNAYGACFWRAFSKTDYTSALAWCDSMFALNSTCVPAYRLKAMTYRYGALNDSLAEITALDSTIAILNRFGDPALGDTSQWMHMEWEWYNYTKKLAEYVRGQVIGGRRWMMTL